MTADTDRNLTFWDIFAPINRTMMLDWDAEYEEFKRCAAAYMRHVIDLHAGPDEPDGMRILQSRILTHMILACEPDELITPAALADAINERNRKAVREAGRRLAAHGIIAVTVEPSPDAEGERVLGLSYPETLTRALDVYLDEQRETLQVECAAAAKQ